MPVSLEKKIIDYKIKPVESTLQERDEILSGCTYKIKPPDSDHAIYVTINDVDGKPYELFINCKNPESYSWIMTIARLISAILRTDQDPTFMIEELKNSHDPRGGYYYPKMGFIPSISAHIGIILERHINARR